MGPADTWDRMAAWLGGFAQSLAATPSAIVVVSAHWEAATVRVTSAPQPPLIYDYHGFPEHTYALSYAAPGHRELADGLTQRLNHAGIEAVTDPNRGFDHGVFIPLKLMFPAANIPVVQISLQQSLDPVLHLRIGEVLAPLRDDSVLIVGSGMSFHNLPLMMSGTPTNESADVFDDWLSETCLSPPALRNSALSQWERAPSARIAHPREEHLLPLMVAAGAAHNDSASCVFKDRVMGSTVSAFAFG